MNPYPQKCYLPLFFYPTAMWKNPIGHQFVEKLNLEEKCSDYVLYISIPFCRVRCKGCPYFVKLLTKKDPRGLEERYIEALIKDIKKWGSYPRWQKGRLRAIYIGGGTGSILKARHDKRLLEALEDAFPISDSTEITLEGNASDYNEEKLDLVAQSLINRVSLGVQSFNEEVLKVVGSPHAAQQSVAVIKELQARGISNIQIDMMFNMPKHTMDVWEEDLKKLESLNIKHLTTYLYRIHQNTPQEKLIKEGKIPDIEDRESPMVKQMHEKAVQIARDLGFEMYMFDHFAKKGFSSKYNDWGFQHACETLGIGSGAYSLIANYRIGTSKDIESYIQTVNDGRHLITSISMPMKKNHHKERYVIFSFQYQQIFFQEYEEKFGASLLDDFNETIFRLKKKKLIEIKKDRITLTSLGKEWKMNVFLEFVDRAFWGNQDAKKELNWSMNVPMVDLLSDSREKWLGVVSK